MCVVRFFLFQPTSCRAYSVSVMGGQGSGRKRTQPHGTEASYQRGCRCGRCRVGHREYSRNYRRAGRYYADAGICVGMNVALSLLTRRILSATEARTGKSSADIVEQLVRLHGSTVEFDDVEPSAAEAVA